MKSAPASFAESLVDTAEESIPDWWTTDQIADFWHRMTEACTLRLIHYKPEMVSRWPPEDQ